MVLSSAASHVKTAVDGAARVKDAIAPLAVSAAKTYLVTAGAMIALTSTLAAVCAVSAGAGSWLRGGLGALSALAFGTVAGVMLSGKRAVSAALLEGARRARLGTQACELVFTRLLGVSADERHGERGVALAQRGEQLPLAQAEARLRSAVDALVREPDTDRGLRAWLRRKIRGVLLDKIEVITVARFRVAAQQHGGVDLIMVQNELSTQIDERLVDHLQGAALRATLLVLALLAAACALAVVAIRQIPW